MRTKRTSIWIGRITAGAGALLFFFIFLTSAAIEDGTLTLAAGAPRLLALVGLFGVCVLGARVGASSGSPASGQARKRAPFAAPPFPPAIHFAGFACGDDRGRKGRSI